jgi:hypothetical protein
VLPFPWRRRPGCHHAAVDDIADAPAGRRGLMRHRWVPHTALFVLALGLRVGWVLAVEPGPFGFND